MKNGEELRQQRIKSLNQQFDLLAVKIKKTQRVMDELSVKLRELDKEGPDWDSLGQVGTPLTRWEMVKPKLKGVKGEKIILSSTPKGVFPGFKELWLKAFKSKSL